MSRVKGIVSRGVKYEGVTSVTFTQTTATYGSSYASVAQGSLGNNAVYLATGKDILTFKDTYYPSTASITKTSGSYYLNPTGYYNASGSSLPSYAFKQYMAYTVSASATEGGSVTGAGEYDEGSQVVLTAVPSTGYRFVKWSGGASGTSATLKFTASADKTVVANFERQKLTVEWNTCGGNAISDTAILYGDTLYAPENPVKDSTSTSTFSFDGWYTSISGGTRVTFPVVSCTEGRTYYAHWTAIGNTYRATFDSNGGSSETYYMDVDAGSKFYPNTKVPEKIGHKFSGWKDANGNSVSFPVSIDSDTTFYAQWSPISYRIELISSGDASASRTYQDMTYNVSANIADPGYAKDGFVQTGWAVEPGGEVYFDMGQSVRNLSPVDGYVFPIYAAWERNTWRLGIHPGYGSDIAEEKDAPIVTGKTTWNAIGKMTRTGYSLVQYNATETGTAKAYDANGNAVAGTYWDASGSTAKFLGAADKSSDSFGVRAQWTPVSYRIKRIEHLLDTAQRIDGQTSTASFGSVVTLAAPTRAHYRFTGWKATKGLSISTARWGRTSTEENEVTYSTLMFNGVSSPVYVRSLSSVAGTEVWMSAEFQRIRHDFTVLNRTNNVSADEERRQTDWPADDGWDMTVLLEGEPAPGLATDSWQDSETKYKYQRGRFSAYAGNTYTIVLTAKAKSRDGSYYRVPMQLSDGTRFVRTDDEVPTWVATRVVSDTESQTTLKVESGYVQITSRTLPEAIGTSSLPFAHWEMKTGEDRVVVGTANTEIPGAVFASWGTGESATSSAAKEFELAQNANVQTTVAYVLGTVSVSCAVDALSAAAGFPSSSVSVKKADGTAVTGGKVPYGSSVVFSADNQSGKFSGWYRADGSLASADADFATSALTADTAVYARYKASVTVSRSIVQSEGKTIGALLHWDGDRTGSDTDSITGLKEIGSSFSFAVTPTGDGVFAGWYSVSGSTRTLLVQGASGTMDVLGDVNVLCVVQDKALDNFIAVYNVNGAGTIESSLGSLGTISVTGDNVTKLSGRSEYESQSGLTAESDNGQFFKIPFGTSFTIATAQASSLPYSGITEKVGGGAAASIAKSTNPSPAVVAKGDAVYKVRWGAVSKTRVVVKYSRMDGIVVGRGRPGFDCENFSVDERNDECVAQGYYETGSTMTVMASASNGYGFVKLQRTKKNGDVTSSTTEPVWTGTFSPIGDDDAVYFRAVFAKENVSLYRWEGGSENMTATWKSKMYVLSKPANMTSVRVDAQSYPSGAESAGPVLDVRVDTYSSPTGAATNTGPVVLAGGDGSGVTGQRMRRLPPRRPERYFQVQVQSNSEVDAVFIGTSGPGLET